MNDENNTSDSKSVSLVERNLSEYYIGRYGALRNYYGPIIGVNKKHYSGKHNKDTSYDALEEDSNDSEEDSENDSEDESEVESENESEDQSENDTENDTENETEQESEEQSQNESDGESENESEEESDDEPVKKNAPKNKEDTKNEEKKDLRQGKGDIIRKTLNNTNPNKDKFNDSNNKFKAPLKNLNYNDITRQLNSYEISDVIKGLKENIPNEDLVNVWIQTLGVCKSGGHDMISNLKNYEKSCLSEYKKIILPHYGGPPREKNPEEYWEKCLYDFEVKLLNASYEYNSKFYELLNKKDKLFKIKKFLFSCLDEFSNLKKQLYKEYKNELYDNIMRASGKKYSILKIIYIYIYLKETVINIVYNFYF